MAQTVGDELSQRAQLLPTKDTLIALKSDVNLESACLELCDNALDAWKRTSNREESTCIDIDVHSEDDVTGLIIRDDAGGIPREDAAMLFGLGQTANDAISGSIGTYGVGAKKSLVNLGVPFRISSRSVNEETGWTYRITEDWFNDDQDWSVKVHEHSDLEPGVTEIQIEDLNYEWDAETATTLSQRLGEAYNLFLSDEMQHLHNNSYDLTIRVDGDPVEPEGVPNWAFSPFDQLHPRRFENVRIEVPSMAQPVWLHITVGLLKKKDSQNAGTDIYCQKRKVATSIRSEEGGYGSGTNRLGNFNARHQRLKVIVELETEGDGQQLPWDTQKSSVDKHHPIMRGSDDSRGVYNWLRRTVQDYFELDADKVPQAFVEPYDATSEFAVNGGDPVQLDYSGRKRVISDHRPDTDLPQLNELKKKAAAHATLWISAEDSLEHWQIPAYNIQLQQESDRNIENLTTVSELPPQDVVKEPHQAAGKINELARIHLEHGVYYPDELDEWQTPRYTDYIERHDNEGYSQPDGTPEDIPLTPDTIGKSNHGTASSDNTGDVVYIDRSIKDETVLHESAELFLVLGGESSDERVAKILDTNRKNLCKHLGVDTDAVDEIIWEKLTSELSSIAES